MEIKNRYMNGAVEMTFSSGFEKLEEHEKATMMDAVKKNAGRRAWFGSGNGFTLRTSEYGNTTTISTTRVWWEYDEKGHSHMKECEEWIKAEVTHFKR